MSHFLYTMVQSVTNDHDSLLILEMRQKFDDGEDPLDPEQKAGFQQNPFGGFPFGSGQGFTFKFKWT